MIAVSATAGHLARSPDTPADRKDLEDAVAFALRVEGRKRIHQADEYMAAIAAERFARHLERAGFVVTAVSDRRRGDRPWVPK